MRKKIIAMFMLFLTIAMICISITPKKVLAEIGSDIGGEQITGGGNYNEEEIGYKLRLSTIIKVSLVDISQEELSVIGYHYYIYKNDEKSSLYYEILSNTWEGAEKNSHVQVVDAAGEQRDLNFGGTGVTLVKRILFDNLVLEFLFHGNPPNIISSQAK